MITAVVDVVTACVVIGKKFEVEFWGMLTKELTVAAGSEEDSWIVIPPDGAGEV